MKYCEKCGNQLFDEAVMCPKCGCNVASKQPSDEENENAKNQAKATVLFIAAIAVVVIGILLVMMQL